MKKQKREDMNSIRNDLSASKQKVIIYIFACLTLLGGVGTFFPDYLEPQWALILLAAVSFIILLAMLLGNHSYVWIVVENDKLKIRYYSVISFLRKFRAIEIPLDSFKGYSIKKSILGLRKELILKQKVKNQIGTYPPVYISTMSTKEHNALIALLNQYSQK